MVSLTQIAVISCKWSNLRLNILEVVFLYNIKVKVHVSNHLPDLLGMLLSEFG